MSRDSDSEYEVEEFTVFADFKNQLVANALSDPKNAFKLIGVDSKNPIAEVNGCVFKGEYEYPIGTLVFFEKSKNDEPVDPLYETTAKQKYKYYAKTNKVLNFQRLYVQPKEESTAAKLKTTTGGNADNQPKEQTTKECSVKVDMSYEDIIKQLPKQPPRNA